MCEYSVVNLSDLSRIEASGIIDKDTLVKAGLVRPSASLVKVLGDGELSTPVKVKAHKFSKSAEEKIKSAGGEIIQA